MRSMNATNAAPNFDVSGPIALADIMARVGAGEYRVIGAQLDSVKVKCPGEGPAEGAELKLELPR